MPDYLLEVVPFHQRRGNRGRRSMGVNPIQSYKKVLNFAPTSRAAAATIVQVLVQGVDSTAAGQTAPTDPLVPTGAIVKWIEIHFSWTNLVSISHFMHMSIQHLRSGQASISPLLVGGDPQRNQVNWQMMRAIGKDQNANIVIKFKVPLSMQRVRDGDKWDFVFNGSTVYTNATQVIYKFYR